ncbi:MAG: AAA family ATPase [Kiloniellales bacterium]
MSAAEEFLSQPFPETSGVADCVAFVSDNQTHDMVANVVRQFFAEPQVRDGGPTEALAYLSSSDHPKVMIIDIGDSSDPVSAMLSLTTAFPEDVKLIGIGTINDISLYRELTEAGVLDYLVKPISEKALGSALTRLSQPAAKSEDAPGNGVRIAVVGARGGVGSTAVSVNLAWLAAEERKLRTILVDLDLWFGTAALALDLEPTRGLREALEDPARIDSLFLSSATAKLSEHLSVMATEEALTGDMMYNTGATEILIESLSHNYRCLVIDLPRSAFRMRHPVLRTASQVVLVTEMSLAGLRDSIRLFGAFEEAAERTPVTIVGNRVGGANDSMPLNEFQKALGRKVDILIPDDPKSFKVAANSGKPMIHNAPRSKAAKMMRQLADKVVTVEADASKTHKGLWNRLTRKA